MKRYLPYFALVLLAGCTSPIGSLSRIFPDGASFEVQDAQLIVTGTGGTLTAKSIRSIGTNGFKFPDGTTTITNVIAPAINVPKGTVLKVQ